MIQQIVGIEQGLVRILVAQRVSGKMPGAVISQLAKASAFLNKIKECKRNEVNVVEG